MTSAVSPAKLPPQNNAPQSAHPANAPNNAASPPSKRDLKSWWKKFQNQSKHQDAPANRPQGIFGVPLRQSITYANVAISLIDEDGKSYIYGYVPIVVAKCGVFLKEKATGVEGIFRLSGSEKRIKELKTQFDSPDRYGKGLVWDGYTVHDAANVLRRYLNDLPEPVVPLDLYEKFREPLRGQTQQAVGDAEGPQLNDDFDQSAAIAKYEQLIKDLPPLNRQLLLYLLDLLAVFAAKADENRMTSQNLAAIFQPGMLSHPSHAMAPDEYRLNQCVIIFLIENQDHFLIGMQGTAADEKTKQAIEKGTPPINSPATPNRKSGIVRSASNASAGAESVSRDGKIRRNRSTSSRHSRQSNGASTPGSPALGTGNSALGRSNTVPSKKSPGIASARFQRHGSPAIAMTPASPSPTSTGVLPPPTVSEELVQTPSDSTEPSAATGAGLGPGSNAGAGRSQERLLEPTPEIVTPSKERNLQSLFNRSPKDDLRQPNKLRKKRLPGSANPSAQSSTTSLPHSRAVSPSIEASNPFEKRNVSHGEDFSQTPENAATADQPSDQTRKAAEVPPQPNHENSSGTLKPKESQSASLHSSFNEGSDIDQVPEETGPSTIEHQEKEKEKKRRWRLSRRKEETAESSNTPTSPKHAGANAHEGMSATSLGSSGQKPRKSLTNDSSEAGTNIAESDAGSHRDESRGPLGWIKNKYREAKETAEQRRTKSPPAEGRGSLSSGPLPTRGKSLDIKRGGDEKEKPVVAHPAVEPSARNASGETRSSDINASAPAPAPTVASGPAAAAEEKQESITTAPVQ